MLVPIFKLGLKERKNIFHIPDCFDMDQENN